MQMFHKYKLYSLFLIPITLQSHALVNPVNGSFSEVLPFGSTGNSEFQFELIYNHQSAGSESMGKGWCTNLDHQLDLSLSTPEFIYCGSGEKIPVEKSKSASKANSAPHLTKHEGRNIVSFPNGKKFYFDLQGKLIGIWNSTGQHLIKRQKQSITVSNDEGEILQIETDSGGRLKKIQSKLSSVLLFWEGESLQRIKYDEKTWAFDYDEQKRMKQWKGPKTVKLLRYNNADLVQSITSQGCVESLEYKGLNESKAEVQVSSTCPKDRSQAPRTFTLSSKGETLEIVEKNQKTNESTVLTQNRIDGSTVSIIRNDGNEMIFDQDGKISQVLNKDRREIWKYPANDRVQVNVMEKNHFKEILFHMNSAGQVEALAINQHHFKTKFRWGAIQELRGEVFRAVKTDNSWSIHGLSKTPSLRAAGEKLSLQSAIEALTRFHSVREM